MPEDDLTLGELGRRLDAHTAAVTLQISEVKEDLHGVEKKVDDLTQVNATLAAHTARLNGHDLELRDLKDVMRGAGNRTALWLSTAAAVISGASAWIRLH